MIRSTRTLLKGLSDSSESTTTSKPVAGVGVARIIANLLDAKRLCQLEIPAERICQLNLPRCATFRLKDLRRAHQDRRTLRARGRNIAQKASGGPYALLRFRLPANALVYGASHFGDEHSW